MKCKFCGRLTDFITIKDEPICEKCVTTYKYTLCTHCGKYFEEKDAVTSENLCVKCLEVK